MWVEVSDMSESRNTQVVKDAYAAFGRGDVKTILELLTDDVQWEGVKGAEGVARHSGVRRGKPAVAEFFGQVGSDIAFDQFEPREFVAQGDAVVAVGRYRGAVRSSGGRFDADWVMIFNFRDGKVSRFREFTDSAQIIRSYAPAATATA